MFHLLQIGVVIEDKEFFESSMNGQPWKAGKFAHSLRCSLWSEHLGLLVGEVGNIDETFTKLSLVIRACLLQINIDIVS